MLLPAAFSFILGVFLVFNHHSLPGLIVIAVGCVFVGLIWYYVKANSEKSKRDRWRTALLGSGDKNDVGGGGCGGGE